MPNVPAVYANQHMFSSDMMPSQHKELNKVLNGLVTNPPDPSNRLRYKRIKQVDTFYQVNGRKVRVSSLAETGEVTDVILKEKVDHLDIFCPAQNLDLRISVNTETPGEFGRRHRLAFWEALTV
jgi:polynucleotide 5'-triphosphatase